MKPWYTSKTLWINLLAIGALIAQSQFGYILSPEIQAAILGIVNLVLRTVTNSPLDWSGSSTPPNESATDTDSQGTATAGHIRLPLLFLLAAFACLSFLVGGCATSGQAAHVDTPLQTAGKSLLAVKGSIVTASAATARLCQVGTIGVEKCVKAKQAYAAAKPAYDFAMESYLLMSSGGGNAADFGAALLRIQNIAADLLLITGAAPMDGAK